MACRSCELLGRGPVLVAQQKFLRKGELNCPGIGQAIGKFQCALEPLFIEPERGVGNTRLRCDAAHDIVDIGHARDRFGIDEGNDLDAIEPGLRQGIDQRDLTRGRDRSLLDLKAFARAFLGDVNSVLGRSLIIVGSVCLHGNNPTLGERRNLVRTKAKLAENLCGVLADRRRLPPQREIMGADFDRQSRQLGAKAAGELNLQHAAAGIELRVFKDVARLGDRRKRNIDAVEQFGKFGLLMPRDDAARRSAAASAAHAHAIFIGLIRRILQEVWPGELRRKTAAIGRRWSARQKSARRRRWRTARRCAQAPSRAGIGGSGRPVTTSPAMCCIIRNAVDSNKADLTICPRPVRSRSRSAAWTPITANMPPMMSTTDDPARSGWPGGPVI